MSASHRNQRNPDQAVDWGAVKSRLARAAEALVDSEQRSTEQARWILETRAQRLAQLPDRTPDASEILELLKFQRGDDAFAIETRYVHEVLCPGEITVVPGVASFLVGVTNLRGEVLAVMDLGVFYRPPTQPGQEHHRVIVLGSERPEFGIVADLVDEVVTRPIEDILPVPPSVPAEGIRYLTGVMADAMLVMDGASILKDSRLYVDQDE